LRDAAFRSLGVARADEEGNEVRRNVAPCSIRHASKLKRPSASARHMAWTSRWLQAIRLPSHGKPRKLGLGTNILDAGAWVTPRSKSLLRWQASKRPTDSPRSSPSTSFTSSKCSAEARGHIVGMTGDVSTTPSIEERPTAASRFRRHRRAALRHPSCAAPGLSVISTPSRRAAASFSG